MPRSAIDTGLADVVAPAAGAARAAHRPARRRPVTTPSVTPEPGGTRGALEKIVLVLRSGSATTSRSYKKSTLERRDRAAHGAPPDRRDPPSYVRYLQENPQEQELLVQRVPDRGDELLPGSAGLGCAARRGPSRAARRAAGGRAAARLGRRGAPPARRPTRSASSSWRRWRRCGRRRASRSRSSRPIWTGTRSSRRAAGSYPANIASDVSPQRLRRFFVKEEGRDATASARSSARW